MMLEPAESTQPTDLAAIGIGNGGSNGGSNGGGSSGSGGGAAGIAAAGERGTGERRPNTAPAGAAARRR